MPENFPLALWFPVKFGENAIKTLISTGEGGRERRRSKVSVAKKSISFPLNDLTASELTTLYNFYVARNGAYEAFNITVNGTVYLVRFAKDGLTWEWFQQNWYKSSISLQEVSA